MYQPKHIPLSLYIHMPWCIRKCPYCDFNSHELAQGLSLDLEQQYLAALVQDFQQQQPFIQQRKISSIFIGGGTPSLISPEGYDWLFSQLKQLAIWQTDCEVTMEANPGTLEHAPFVDYLHAGINRLSIGIQSFDNQQLQRLGRIHDSQNAQLAVENAQKAGFRRINIDLMHGLPQQSIQQALFDLQMAIDLGASHISWYQLTIEPNTVFYRSQPTLPHEEILEQIQSQGEQILRHHGFVQYEVSAWRKEQPSQHNLNYWQFGDYLAIGAGAHGKVSLSDGIYRFQKTRLPKDYLAKQPAAHIQFQKIQPHELPFEFMMNALRLVDGVEKAYYQQRTGLDLQDIMATLQRLQQKKLLQDDPTRLCCTPLGLKYLNSVLDEFL